MDSATTSYWTGLDDNVRILGLAGGTNHYERLYRRFDRIYRGTGALANPNSPVIPPSSSFDTASSELLDGIGDGRDSPSRGDAKFEFTGAERDQIAQEVQASRLAGGHPSRRRSTSRPVRPN